MGMGDNMGGKYTNNKTHEVLDYQNDQRPRE